MTTEYHRRKHDPLDRLIIVAIGLLAVLLLLTAKAVSQEPTSQPKPDVRRIEQANGLMTIFDANKVERYSNGWVNVMIFPNLPPDQRGGLYSSDSVILMLTCQGTFSIMDGDDISDQMVVPPNSIAGKIEEIVCWKKPASPSPSTAPTLWSGSTSVSPPPPKRDIRTIQHDDGVSKQGDVTIFDMNTIQVAPDGSITVLTSSGPPNTGFFDGILVMVHLDCQGHVALDEKDRALPKWVSMRPNSVAGKIADIVCRSRKP